MPKLTRLGLALILYLVFFPQSAAARASTEVSIQGRVINDVTGLAIPGARVVLNLGPDNKLRTVSDSAGRFRFDGLQPGTFGLSAEKPGFMSPEDGPSRWGGGFSIRLQEGQSLTDAKLRLLPAGVIAGRITDPNGLPIADSGVEVVRTVPIDNRRINFSFEIESRLPDGKSRLEALGRARTNDLGEYRIWPFRAGLYYVVAYPDTDLRDSDKSYRATYYPHALNLASAAPVNLATGQVARADIQIIRQAGVKVSGRIQLPAGFPTGDAALFHHVLLSPAMAGLRGSGGSFGSLGQERFEMSDVMPGTYVLQATTSKYPQSAKPVLAARQTIEVGPWDMEGIVVQLQPLREIQGRVKFQERCEATTVVVNLDGPSRLATTSIEAKGNEDETFVLTDLVPGRYILRTQLERRLKDPPYLVSAFLGGRDVLKEGFEVSGPISDPLLITMGCIASAQSRYGAVEGTILDDARISVARAAALFLEKNSSASYLFRTDKAGKFTVKIPPGNYSIFTCPEDPPDGNWRNPDFLKSCHAEPEVLTVSQGTVSRIEMSLPAVRQK